MLPPRRRSGALLTVVAAHVLLGGWLWHATARTAPAAAPAERLQMVVLLPPEPTPVARPEPPAPPPKPAPKREPRPVRPDAPPSPITLPPEPEAAPESLQPAAEPAPVAPPAAEPVAVAAAAVAPPPPPAEPKLLPASAVRYLRAPSPTYPMLSLRQQEAGVVLVRILVDEAGEPREVRLEQSSGYKRLDQAALDAAQRARFAPYVEQGVARSVWVVAPIHFALDRHS